MKLSFQGASLIFSVLVLFLLTFPNISHSQKMPGESFTIDSEIMGTRRDIQVALPEGYNEWDAYDVQFMLDPVWNMMQRKSMLEFLRNNSMAPRTILVGLVSPDRNSDMLPHKIENFPTSGNSDKFIDFIIREVKPFIDKKYKTSGRTTFAGHSFGGLCVMYAFLKNSEAFDSYLIGDPSFWYKDQYLVELAKENLGTVAKGKVLFIGGRQGNAYTMMGVDAMEKILESHAPDHLDWKTVAYEDETHNSVMYKLNYDGMKFISKDYRNSLIKIIPTNGEVVPGIPLTIYLRSDTKEMRYTLNGKEPTFEDDPFIDSINISDLATLKIKVPLKSTNLRPAVKGEFSKGEKLKGFKKKKNLVKGLNYSYYEGSWNKLPDFDTLSIIKKGTMTEGFDLKSFPKKEEFGCVLEGYFEVTESGYQIFSLSSDDGIKLYVHDKLMINHDWRHSTWGEKSTALYLEKGLHPIRIEYFQYKGTAAINLHHKAPNKKPDRLGANLFWRKPEK